jgi:hypothetical protein|tara:strand:+ start:13151 stop:13384 length:234 start_codon:yes stop_codon:yes gene_type:complete
MSDNQEKVLVGTLIRDGKKIGIVFKEIKSGTWSEQPLFNWRTNYEIYYEDGSVCVMGSDTLDRLIQNGKIELIEDNE